VTPASEPIETLAAGQGLATPARGRLRRLLTKRDASRLVGTVGGCGLTAVVPRRLDAPTTALLGAILRRSRGGERRRWWRRWGGIWAKQARASTSSE
jgi:hypothetical protein